MNFKTIQDRVVEQACTAYSKQVQDAINAFLKAIEHPGYSNAHWANIPALCIAPKIPLSEASRLNPVNLAQTMSYIWEALTSQSRTGLSAHASEAFLQKVENLQAQYEELQSDLNYHSHD